jgi:hypothetical protein
MVRTWLPDESRADDVTDFVARQIAAMPVWLRAGYRVGLVAFEWLAVFSAGGPFRDLDAAAQRRYVAGWDESGFAPFADFIRPLRCCALLRYFDDPRVRREIEA